MGAQRKPRLTEQEIASLQTRCLIKSAKEKLRTKDVVAILRVHYNSYQNFLSDGILVKDGKVHLAIKKWLSNGHRKNNE